MIVKKYGKRVTTSEYVIDTMETYELYRELCFDLHEAKRRKYLKPAVISTIVVGFLGFLTQAPVLFSVTGFLAITAAIIYVFSLVPQQGDTIPIDKSESGASLTHLPYPLNTSNRGEAAADFQKIYGKPISVSGSLNFEEKPLDTPVVIEEQRVVGAFVEVELFDVEEPSDYRIMLEDGVGVQVERHVFLDMIQALHETEDGTKQYIPVLTGRQESVLWGMVGDMQVSTAKAIREKNTKRRIPALRQAIADKEEVFSYIELQNMTASLDD